MQVDVQQVDVLSRKFQRVHGALVNSWVVFGPLIFHAALHIDRMAVVALATCLLVRVRSAISTNAGSTASMSVVAIADQTVFHDCTRRVVAGGGLWGRQDS